MIQYDEFFKFIFHIYTFKSKICSRFSIVTYVCAISNNNHIRRTESSKHKVKTFTHYCVRFFQPHNALFSCKRANTIRRFQHFLPTSALTVYGILDCDTLTNQEKLVDGAATRIQSWGNYFPEISRESPLVEPSPFPSLGYFQIQGVQEIGSWPPHVKGGFVVRGTGLHPSRRGRE